MSTWPMAATPRIQVFDNNLKLAPWIHDTVGTPWALCFTEGPTITLYSASNLSTRPATRTIPKAEIYKMELDGRVLGRIGYADSTITRHRTEQSAAVPSE